MALYFKAHFIPVRLHKSCAFGLIDATLVVLFFPRKNLKKRCPIKR